MPISFNCTCGKPLKSKDEMAGRKTKCPQCGAALTIPGTLVKPAVQPVKVGAAAPVNPDALEVEGLVWTSSDATAGDSSSESTAVSSAPQTAVDPPRPSDLPKPTDGSMQYKILTQKDHSMTGKMNFQNIEVILNDLGRQGWTLKNSFVIDVQSHTGHHDELILILER